MYITVKVMATDSTVTALSVAIAVTLMCTSLSQHCHFHCCHNVVLVFAATVLSSFSLSQRCAHGCLTTVEFLPCREFFMHHVNVKKQRSENDLATKSAVGLDCIAVHPSSRTS